MTDNYPSTRDVIISLQVRLGELDLEIHDAKKTLKQIKGFSGRSCYEAGYQEGVRDILIKEKKALAKIMRGEYGRKASE